LISYTNPPPLLRGRGGETGHGIDYVSGTRRRKREKREGLRTLTSSFAHLDGKKREVGEQESKVRGKKKERKIARALIIFLKEGSAGAAHIPQKKKKRREGGNLYIPLPPLFLCSSKRGKGRGEEMARASKKKGEGRFLTASQRGKCQALGKD